MAALEPIGPNTAITADGAKPSTLFTAYWNLRLPGYVLKAIDGPLARVRIGSDKGYATLTYSPTVGGGGLQVDKPFQAVHFEVQNEKVVDQRQPAPSASYVGPSYSYASPSGGMTVDSEARAAVDSLAGDTGQTNGALAALAADLEAVRAALRAHGLTE